MKKILSFITVCALALSVSLSASAQVKFGVKGGLNLTNLSGDVVSDIKEALSTYTGFHAGIALNVGLPLGFALQPEVLYTQSGVKQHIDFSNITGGLIKDDVSTTLSIGAIQIPVALQWGVELGPVRPFVQAVPYISFPMTHSLKSVYDDTSEKMSLNDMDIFSTVDYGVGLGAGVDLWKLQVALKYNWALGSLVKAEKSEDQSVITDIKDAFVEDLSNMKSTKVSGFEISVAYFF